MKSDMTDQEIKKLAQKIAKILYDEDESYNGMLWWSVEPKERKAEELEMTLKVLLRDHCIVSREVAKKELDDAKLFADNLEKETYEYGYYLGKKTILNKLLGKANF